jgi:hypothetical protein
MRTMAKSVCRSVEKANDIVHGFNLCGPVPIGRHKVEGKLLVAFKEKL